MSVIHCAECLKQVDTDEESFFYDLESGKSYCEYCARQTCPVCHGEGEVDNYCRRHGGMSCDCEVRPSTVTCERCNGDKTVEVDW